MGRVPLLNIHVDNLTMVETLDRIKEMIKVHDPSYVVPVNVDVVIKSEKDKILRTIIDSADLVLTDGQPLIWISRQNHRPIQEKVSGSDLIPKLCSCAEKEGYSIFLLGGKNDVAKEAVKRLQQQFPALQIKGVYSPPIGFEDDCAELAYIDELISKAAPDILVVCLGCPKQEKWVAAHYQRCGATVCICAGATVDFLAGRVKRAPVWMSSHGLEWLYRFFQEPKRLFRRYFIDDMKILRLAWKYRSEETE